MAGGYCLRWTAWRVWLHPRKALRNIEESAEVTADLQQRFDEAVGMLERQRKETAVQSLRVADLSRQLTDTDRRLADEHRELEETRLKLTKALDSLAEHKSVDEKLAEFQEQLSKVEELKRRYEKRITELEARLGDAKKRLAVADASELVEPIDMTDTRRFPAGAPKLRPNGSTPRFLSPNNPKIPHHSTAPRPSFISRTSDQVSAPSSPSSGNHNPGAASSADYDTAVGLHRGAAAPEALHGSQPDTIKPSDMTRPYYEEKDTVTIEGTPEETSQKVAAYLQSLQKDSPKKRAGRSDDDWLSELPDL